MISKFFKWLVITMCSVIVGVYLFRTPLTILSANHYLKPQTMTLECVAWSLSGWMQVDIEKLCLKTHYGMIQLEGVRAKVEQITVRSLVADLNWSQREQPTKSAQKTA